MNWLCYDGFENTIFLYLYEKDFQVNQLTAAILGCEQQQWD